MPTNQPVIDTKPLPTSRPTTRTETPKPTRKPVTPRPTPRPETPKPTRKPVTPRPTPRPETEADEEACYASANPSTYSSEGADQSACYRHYTAADICGQVGQLISIESRWTNKL
ncbi:hypothetical protein THAOC_08662 [Thalassiosira oceanica]|uniref:Uncharacterized protein n=1 Tax=Thalassiosira oceanica TaxID=159749 RepID=K0SUE0_THAOC|nr:hypothetical protein THAOC_08662 [Thalassiosira oceanica]|eukprot:EJK70018.1 hypothetical protein THAOC_08662 [Thalassiosira oceanica]